MLTYLTSPYSHPKASMRLLRYKQACKAAGHLMKEGFAVFSPIAHSHSIEAFFDTIEPGPFWMKQDIPILKHCDQLIVLELDGWDRSKGVAQELELARKAYMNILRMDPVTYALY